MLLIPAVCDAESRIEEIVVTAQKRTQNLQDVSIAMTTFSGGDVRALRFSDPIDVASHTTGLDIKNTLGVGQPILTIRGVGLNDFVANNSQSVGVYVDQVFLTSPAMMSFQLYDIDRVEVLKGPQGALYGRNTTAGALNFISRRPDGEADSYVDITYGSFEHFELEGGIGADLTNTLDGRISFKTVQRNDGHISNLTTGNSDYGQLDRLAVRGQLLWRFSDSAEVLFNLHGGQEDSDSGAAWKPFGILDFTNGVPDPDIGLPVCQSFANTGRSDPSTGCHDLGFYSDLNFNDPYTGEWNSDPKLDIDTWGAAATMKVSFGKLEFDSISGYETFDRVLAEDVDGPNRGLDITFFNEAELFSQELRLSSTNVEGINWIGGLFFSTDEVRGIPSQEIVALDWLSTQVRVEWEQETDVVALFGQIDYPLNDRWRMKIGGRWTKEKRSYIGGSRDLNPIGSSLFLPPGLNGPLQLSQTNTSVSSTDFSGNIGVDYTPSDDVLVYASLSNGFKSGGIPGGFTVSDAELQPYEPEDLNAFEVGTKIRFVDTNMQLNAAAFFYDHSGLQLFRLPPGEITTRLTNSDKAEIAGLEADVTWNPTSEFDFRFGISLLDTENKDPDFDGLELPNAPKLTYNVRARYEIAPSDSFLLSFMVAANYSDERFTCVEALVLCRARDYTIVDARIGFGNADGRWSFDLWSKNLFDEVYEVEIVQLLSLGMYFSGYNMPRTSGLTFTFRWQ